MRKHSGKSEGKSLVKKARLKAGGDVEYMLLPDEVELKVQYQE